MIRDYDAFIAHLRTTGRLKLLPQVLLELHRDAEHERRVAERVETAADHPSLISGWRSIKDGMLTDHTGKSALIAIYRNIIA